MGQIKITNLPVLPSVMASILALDDNNEMNFRELERIIQTDQAMTTLVLKAANSSFYSRSGSIRTIQHAIAMLGFKMVRSLTILSSGKALFGSGNYARFRKHVWQHSIVTAMYSRTIAEKSGHKEIMEEAFVAGLLHDIGKAVLNMNNRALYIQVFDSVERENLNFAEAEKKLLGITHHEAGKMAIDTWNIPGVFAVIASEHDDDNVSNGNPLLNIVKYANYLACAAGFGHTSERDPAFPDEMQKELKLTQADEDYYCGEYAEQLENDEFYKFASALV